MRDFNFPRLCGSPLRTGVRQPPSLCPGFLLLVLVSLFAGGCQSAASKADFMNMMTHQWAGEINATTDDAVSAVQGSDRATQALAANPKPTTQQVHAVVATAHTCNELAITTLSKIQPMTVKIDNNSDDQTRLTDTEIAAVATIKASWAYRIGEFELSILVWFLVLEGIHIVAGVLALLLPPPYASYASLISKLCNPLGWTTAILSHFQLNQAATATTSAQTQLTNATTAIAEMANDVKSWVRPNVPFTPTSEAVISKVAGVATAAPEPEPTSVLSISSLSASPPTLTGGLAA